MNNNNLRKREREKCGNLSGRSRAGHHQRCLIGLVCVFVVTAKDRASGPHRGNRRGPSTDKVEIIHQSKARKIYEWNTHTWKKIHGATYQLHFYFSFYRQIYFFLGYFILSSFCFISRPSNPAFGGGGGDGDGEDEGEGGDDEEGGGGDSMSSGEDSPCAGGKNGTLIGENATEIFEKGILLLQKPDHVDLSSMG